MFSLPEALVQKNQALEAAWARYRGEPTVENFVELAVAVNSFTEFLLDKPVVGLHRASHQLEQAVLALFKPDTTHPLPSEALAELDGRVRTLGAQVRAQADGLSGRVERREQPAPEGALRARQAWLFTHDPHAWQALAQQLGHFGIPVRCFSWDAPLPDEATIPLVLVDARHLPRAEWPARVQLLRGRFPTGQIVCLGVRSDFDELHPLLTGGADHCLLEGTPLHLLVERLMELNQREEVETARVLIVEDSKTAGHLIRRTLQENRIASELVHDPRQALAALKQFNPDLVLMDMYMPGCTGVELTRIIRQHPEFLSVPIVYLSGETNVALQVDAMRLGGDHFLTKPFNPVFLSAIVRTKIERYRVLRRTMYHDSLTGLLNHTSGKSTLDVLLSNLGSQGAPVSVVMMDIDHFKQVNDTHGHPVGDQVIRSLAWLLKQRLRRNDVLCRYGGEEFLIALPHTVPAQAHSIMDRLREDFAGIRHPCADGFFQATVSGGIAGFPAYATSDALIQAADAALYEAKRAGRNVIRLAPA